MELLQDLGHMFEDAFGAEDVSTPAMRRAILKWLRLYYGSADGLLKLPYTVVRKITRAVFAEYEPGQALAQVPAQEALELAMIGGESYLKPVFMPDGMHWRCVSRGNILVFGRDLWGEPTDVGMIQRCREGKNCFTLLERRQLDPDGQLRILNRLFRSNDPGTLGKEVALRSWGQTASLPVQAKLSGVGIGLARMKMPMTNCVDGSREGVSIYAPAVELMEAIGENEAQLIGEFRKGKSRLVVSRDMLDRGQLQDELFVALDESPEAVGITVFAPELREQSYLARQQAYLRMVENVIGLKRGLLSQVEAADRTATEITSSEGEYMTTIVELRRAWEQTAEQIQKIGAALMGKEKEAVRIHWGDGIV